MLEENWVYSTWGYGRVIQASDMKVVVELTWGATAYLSKDSITDCIPFSVKSFTRDRKTLSFDWKITQDFSDLFKNLPKQLNLSPNIQIFLYMPRGKLVQINPLDSPLSLKLKKDSKLVLTSRKTFTWDVIKKSQRIELLDDFLAVRKKDDSGIMFDSVFGNVKASGGSCEWEIKIDFMIDYDEEEEIVIGVASKEFNYEDCPSNGGFWGFWAISCRKISASVNEEYGERVNTWDSVIVKLDFKDGKGNLSFQKNGIDLGVAFTDVPVGVFPAVCLNYPKIQVSLGKVRGF